MATTDAGPTRSRQAAYGLVAAFYAAHVLMLVVLRGQTDLRGHINDIWFACGCALPAVLMFRTARRLRPYDPALARAWFVLAWAHTSYALGDVCWAYITVVLRQDAYPSVADVFYVPFYLLFVAGLLLLPRAEVRRPRRVLLLLDLALVTTGAALFFWVCLIQPTLLYSASDLTTRLMTAMYVTLDLALTVTIGQMLLTKLRPESAAPLLLLAASTVAQTVSDWGVGYQTVRNNYVSGDWVDLGWLIGYCLSAFAALLQQRPPERAAPAPPERITWTEFLPYAWVGVALLMNVVDDYHALPVQTAALGWWTALMVGLVLLRQVVVMQDNVRLNRAAQDELAERRAAEDALRIANGRLAETLSMLQTTQEQALRRERLSALGALASGIAHDLNNALAPIVGYTDLLLSTPGALSDSERVQHDLETVNLAARDAAEVVRRLREFHRRREPTEAKRPIDVNKLLAQVLDLGRPRWHDDALAVGITVTVDFTPAPLPLVAGDEAELREVLLNLLLNAADAIIEKRGPAWEELFIDAVPEAGGVRVTLRDTGVGMSPETLARCAEPFFTTKGDRGCGLGLALVHGMVRRTGGRVELSSILGRGTTASLWLPAVGPDEPAASVPEPARGLPVRPLRVLLVDDEPAVRQLLSAYLREDHHAVTTAANGRAALELFAPDRFDLVVTDGAMPELSGLQLAAAVKAQAPDLPVIMVTGYGDLMVAAGETATGVDMLLSKPVTLAVFRAAIASVTPGAASVTPGAARPAS